MDVRNCRRFYYVSTYEYNTMTAVWRCPSEIINISLHILQQLLLVFLLLSGILYMFSFESFTGIRDDAPTFVFPTKYKAGDFLRRKAGISAVVNCESGYFIMSKIQLYSTSGYQDSLPPTWSALQWDVIQTASPDQVLAWKKVFLSHQNKHSSLFSSNGSQHKFMQSSEPADRYVINVNDIAPQMRVEEFFTRVGVSFFQAWALFKNNLTK